MTNPHDIQIKVDLVLKGLPIDVTEEELVALEEILRGARRWYVDIFELIGIQSIGHAMYHTEQAKNMVGVEMALRKVDDARLRLKK